MAFSKLSMYLFLLFLSISSSYATSRLTRDSANPPQYSQAQKLIRSLNLFPKKPVNIFKGDHSDFVPGKIVEKQFSLFGDSEPSIENLGQHAGYYSLPDSKASRMFYLFFESRNSTNDPVVIWLTGGPGCSSELALFYENGPFHIANNLSLIWNDYGWDQASNIIFVDQPTGTGFSYSSDNSDIRRDEAGVSNDLYEFLQGFAIGNGLVNPAIQYPAYPDFALANGVIEKDVYDDIIKSIPDYAKGGESCEMALDICQNLFDSITVVAYNINVYDIRKQCVGPLCYDFGNLEKLLSQKQVKSALGVPNDLEFVSCSDRVHDAMEQDWMRNLEVGIPALLEDGIKMLVYAGEKDLICNWLGNSRWVHAMEWSGQQAFGTSPELKFVADGAEAGLLKSHGPLTFLKVFNAGHMVPMDQPIAALQINANNMGFSKLSVCLMLLLVVSLSFAYADSHFTHHRANSSQSQAQRLIRSLNLFPKKLVNIAKGDHADFVPGKIVEKKFSFFPEPGTSVEDLGHHAGYYSLPHSIAARMFYFFFESRNSRDDPVIIWLAGGPGCSGEVSLFYENGPFHIANDLSLVWSAFGWDQASNIIFVDQPTGTGFSYSFYPSDIRHDEVSVSSDLYDFLQVYDIRKRCVGSLCYDFRNLERLLNLQNVKSALGVANNLEYVSCSTTVHYAMREDMIRNLEGGIPSLLEDGIKMLVYVGDKDLICNWLGNSRWIHAMEWSGQNAFGTSPTMKFVVDGTEAGFLKSYGPLTFLRIFDAGHLVPMDQPKVALEMLKGWMGETLFETKEDN
ncbi:hypothetical protein Fmac_021985 [Flemingia macrophylla]|uniref:Uncharacterized protein n=1 Tax=Flemingia macrophylla TaxID=520843 RepID=A0ABD1LYF1_9FABA